MLNIENVALLSDLVRLPKELLKDICSDLGLPTESSITELASSIWGMISSDSQLQNRCLESHKERLLCGKTSATWYQCTTDSLSGLRDRIVDTCSFNPFERITIPILEELSSDPTLICAAQGTCQSQYYLRFMYKSGVSRAFYGTEMDLRPKCEIKTVFIDEDAGLAEVRADANSSKKFARALTRLSHNDISFSQKKILIPFGNDIEKLADSLEGELIDATAKPELVLDDFTPEQGSAIVEILQALDLFFEEDNIEQLQEQLNKAKETFGDYIAIPFTALILSGLEKVGMGVTGRDLRGLPFYDVSKQYLQNQGGFIQFRMSEDGIVEDYTIRVGLQSDSVYFITPATEKTIKYVRDRIII